MMNPMRYTIDMIVTAAVVSRPINGVFGFFSVMTEATRIEVLTAWRTYQTSFLIMLTSKYGLLLIMI